MILRHLQLRPTASGYLLIAANVVPVLGVLALDWSLFAIVFIYWAENVIIGFFNVLKMIACRMEGLAAAGKLFIIPFFIVHFGGFCAGHGVFVFAMFGGDGVFNDGPQDISIDRAIDMVTKDYLLFALAAVFISHGLSFVLNYIGGGEYKRVDMQKLMAAPYGRIIVLHVFIIFGGFLIMLMGAPKFAILLLAVLKTGFDLAAHNREHRKAD
jgi:hypothetical protein